MEDGEKKPDAGTIGGPQKKIVYAVIAIVVVILAVVLIAKFSFNTDVLNPTSGQMSLVRPVITHIQIVTIPTVTITSKAQVKLCATGLTGCSGTCVDLSMDDRNCGSCGKSCDISKGDFCIGSSCYDPCSDNTCLGVVCGQGTACYQGHCIQRDGYMQKTVCRV
jgi:hypothetical protein